MIVEWPDPAAIHNLSFFINDVYALRPRRIRVIRNVVHVIHREGNWEVETLDEIVSDGHALFGSMRLRVTNTLINVRLHLPFVERMRFANIHGQEIRAILVIVIEIDEVAYLASKRRSGIAAEDQNQRSLPDAIAEMKCRLAIERQQPHIRRRVAHVQAAITPLRQRVTQKPIHVARPAHHVAERSVSTSQHRNQNNGGPFPPTQDSPSLEKFGRYRDNTIRVNIPRSEDVYVTGTNRGVFTCATLDFRLLYQCQTATVFLLQWISSKGGGSLSESESGGRVGYRKSSWEQIKLSRRARRSGALAFLFAAVLIVTLAPLVAQQLSSYKKKTSVPQTAELIRKRAEWFFRQRATQNGHIPGGLLLKAFAQNENMIRERGTFLQKRVSADGSISSQLNMWTPLGPQPTAATQFYGNVSGRITALAADPCDATGNTVYAGGADGGVWVSFNALAGSPVTWQPLTDNEPSLATGAIAINPASCGTFNGHAQSTLIVVGTGESNFAQDNIYGAGVLHSVDGGQTWTQDSTFTKAASQGELASGPYIAALAIQPNNPNPVILADRKSVV